MIFRQQTVRVNWYEVVEASFASCDETIFRENFFKIIVNCVHCHFGICLCKRNDYCEIFPSIVISFSQLASIQIGLLGSTQIKIRFPSSLKHFSLFFTLAKPSNLKINWRKKLKAFDMNFWVVKLKSFKRVISVMASGNHVWLLEECLEYRRKEFLLGWNLSLLILPHR